MKPVTKAANITQQQARASVRAYLRPQPYTDAGLARQRCAHCGAPATDQWSLRPCAIGRTGWYPLCAKHDLELNRLVMDFLRLPDAAERLEAYQQRRAA